MTMARVQELCRKLKPVLGAKIDRLWATYLAESDNAGRSDVWQLLELLAAKHLGCSYQPDRSPFPPPERALATAGKIDIGKVAYGGKELYPFLLSEDRLKEHVLIAGRSGSGKTNLAFVLMKGAMDQGVKILAIDWKRGYRDLLDVRQDLRVYTLGRDVSPFRFNPLIPPPGCEPNVWIKLIVDVIASAYLGGEGVISLLVAGLDKLYRDAGIYDKLPGKPPTIQDLLIWLKTTKLKGRAAMWQASAERILLAMTYGEFGAVVNTLDNGHVRDLLNHNVVLEMDGLSSNSDRKLFSEALTLYLYRYRLAEGPQPELTNLIVLEEAHNLLLRKAAEAKESVLETSIRMIRQYGLGYVFVDQSASMLSKVAFANSYATLALSQKLRSDIQAISSAMNLTDEQKEALTTLPVGQVIVRLADKHPEPFLVNIPRFPVREGSVTDESVRKKMAAYSRDSTANSIADTSSPAIPPLPLQDKNKESQSNTEENTMKQKHPRPPTPADLNPESHPPELAEQSEPELSREATRFLADLIAHPLSTTVSRYHRLSFSRRRGNAIRQQLAEAGLIEAVAIPTRSGQVVLYQLTDDGRTVTASTGLAPGPRPRESLEHRYWVQKTKEHFETKGYSVTCEHQVKGNGAVDLLAERPGEKLAVEIETGKSDIATNIKKIKNAGFDAVVLLATSPAAATACRKARDTHRSSSSCPVRQMTWLDVA